MFRGLTLLLPGGIHPYFRWANSFREPEITVRYLVRNFGSPAFSIPSIPNTTLSPEKGKNIDAGVKVDRSRVKAQLGYFKNKIDGAVGTVFTPIYCIPAKAALNLAGAIAGVDAEIASLESGADPAEAERLAAKINALGPASASEGEGKGQMRDLFQKQLDLLRGFTSRLEILKGRRARQLDLLKALWLQAGELTVAANDAGKARGATDRIRTLCAEIARQIDSSSATRQFDPAITDSPTIERT